MAYTVLARKYRSWTFDQLVGQDAVATTMKNAIASGRLHHGYLFCGTRGVGKTSAARILARSLNCLKADGPTAEPCCECEVCTTTAEGQDVDVIEIDAASNTGVDNIRELRSNAGYRPARARYKVYIIDEVHMLSTGAFNALLKTLEEPPEHVKFVLATTEPQKVPATIQSRCLRFDFRSLSIEEISKHFRWILDQEGIAVDDGVIKRVARLANGSMRDGLSLLDQLLALGSDRLTVEMVDDVLPVPHDELLSELLGKLAANDAAAALELLEQALNKGYSLERFVEGLSEQVRGLMLLRICGAETELVELPLTMRKSMVALAEKFDSEICVHMIAVLEELRRTVRFSTMGRALVEAALVRLSSPVRYQSIASLLEQVKTTSANEPAKKKVVTPPGPAGERAEPAPESQSPQPAKETASVSTEQQHPRGFRRHIEQAQQGRRTSSEANASEQPRPQTPPAQQTSRPAGGRRPRPTTASSADLKAAASDPMVREALELFDGTLVNVERVIEDANASSTEADDTTADDTARDE
jgi:DNA polymerase-3 subunit gamma/tau